MDEPILHAPANPDADLIPVRMCNELVYCPRLFHLEHVQGIFVHSADTIEGAGQHARARRRGTRLRVLDGRKGSTDPRVDPRVDPGHPTVAAEAAGQLPECWRPAGSAGASLSTRSVPVPGPGPAPAPAPEIATADELASMLPRRLHIASEALGVRGEIDLVEIADGSVIVVESKHGKAPRFGVHRWEEHELPYSAWPADVVQVALYVALLRELGMPCDEARIYYRASNARATVPWSRELELFAHAVVARAREVAARPVAPAPLLDSPKCAGCSLHEVCLPDEHHALLAETVERERPLGTRRIVAGKDDRAVVHVLSRGSTVRKDGDGLKVVARTGESDRFLLKDVSHVALFGPVNVTQPCLQHLLRTGVGVSHHTTTGRLLGMTSPLATRNVGMRRAQYRAADDPAQCLEIARALVVAKIRNQRTVLRRHRRGLAVIAEEDVGGPLPEWAASSDDSLEAEEREAQVSVAGALRRMQNAVRNADRSSDIDALRGHEGDAAAQYFAVFPALLPVSWKSDFRGRSRRPPRDRVNALLSFGYALLVRDAVAALARIGLDPMLGLFHTMIPGRPALALDLVEPFRAAWVDTAMLRLVGTGGIDRAQFHVSAAGVELSDAGRRAAVRAYERRAAELTTHPRFGYRMSYRRLLELEARILGKVLVGELPSFTPLWTR